MKKVFKNKYIVGSIVVTIIYMIFLVLTRAYPFGDNTLLCGDLDEQYINFFCYLKEIIQGTKGIFMSWNLGMANGFYTNFTYYLSNPLNILVLLFESSNMYLFVEVIIYIKLLLIFNFFVLYLQKVFNYKKIDLILFGIAYTFSSFTITYLFNVMWLDVLYILPLAILFIKKYIDEDKLFPVILTYIYILFVQYYMAYSMIIFCSIYYIALFWKNENINKQSFKRFIRKSIPIAFATILAVGTAMIIFMPTLNSMHEIISTDNSYINIENLSLLDIIRNFTNRYDYKTTQKLGFTFCGSIITVLFILFLINKKIEIKEKIIYLGMLVFMLIPVISPYFYLIWHGGGPTHGYNFRYCYIIIFILVTIGFRSFQNIDISKKKFIGLYIFFSIMMISSIFSYMNNILYGDKGYHIRIIISGVTIFSITILLYLLSNSKNNKGTAVFICMTLIEIIESILILYYDNGIGTSIKMYNLRGDTIQSIVNKIESPRIERAIIEDERTTNDSIRYDYSTFYFFSSGRNLNTLQKMNKIGYNTKYISIDKRQKTMVNDIISGVKYYILTLDLDSEKMQNCNYNNLLEFVDKVGENQYLYKNNYCFPFLYYIPKNIEMGENIFENQNIILNNYGKETDENFIYNFNDQNNIIKNKIDTEEISDEKYFNYRIKYEITALKDTDIYLEYKSDLITVIKLRKENKTEEYFGDTITSSIETWPKGNAEKYYNNNGIIHIVSLKKGEKYSFEIETSKEIYNPENLQLYAFDDEMIKERIKNISSIFQLEKIEKNGLEANVSVEKDGLLCFEISYDEGWHIEIDGVERKNKDIYGCFLGTDISKGNHNVKIYYIPKGFKEGAIISLISLILLISILIICENTRKKKLKI